MSTRSYILKENDDGTYIGVYCHHDGYLTYNGAMLLDHYNSRERVDNLLSMGNISVLNEKIEPYPGTPHNFESRQEDVSLFYKRDGYSKDNEDARIVNLKDLDDPASWIEYCYIFSKDNKWHYFKCGELNKGIIDLEEGLKEEYKKLGFERPSGYYGFFMEDDIRKRVYEEKAKSQEM